MNMYDLLPKSIVVGIVNVDRYRDFTYPSTDKRDIKDISQSGGSGKFIAFIQQEVQPFLSKHYKINGHKTIIGQSLGGKDSTQHFDISELELKETQFHYGIGRERFPALLKPEFTSIAEADSFWADSTRFLVAHAGDEVKAYSVKDLTRHKVANDSLDGKPIMAAYCILADLGAIYERQYGDKELTFALSGYTYYDDEV